MKNVNDTTPSYDQGKGQPPVGEQQPGNKLNDPSIDPNASDPQNDGEVMEADAAPQSVNATGTPTEKSAVGWNETNATTSSFEEEE